MRKTLFTIFALFLVTTLAAQKPIIINGKIANCSKPGIGHIDKQWFNPETLEEENIAIGFPIAEDGTFQVKITNTHDYYHRYWIYLGNEFTHLDLIEGDSIEMTLDAIYFDETINYTGRGSGRNNYRRDVFLQFWNDEAMSFNKQGDPTQFLYGLNAFTDRRLDLLNNYYKDGEIDSSYYQTEKTLILNDKAELLLSRILVFGDLKRLPISISYQLTSILNAVNLSDENFLQHSQFRNLLVTMPHYKIDGYSIIADNNLKRMIEYANANYSKLNSLYFDKKIMQGYISKANNRSSKVVLLNFFENQFDEPVLTGEMQKLRRKISGKGLLSSEIFQPTLFIVFWVLVFTGLVFLLIKLIQYSNKSKINRSLWLRVGFYLLVSFLAVLNIAEYSYELMGFTLVFCLLGGFLVHTYMLIPRYILNKRRFQYFSSLCALFIVFTGLLLLGVKKSSLLREILNKTNLFFGMVLLSWVSYYIHQMASGKSNLRNLVKNGNLNLESGIHLFIVLLVNLVFVANIGPNVSVNQLTIFYSVLFLFYIHTFFTFPRFFKKGKVLWFIAINAGILLITSVVSIGNELVNSQQVLNSLGIQKTVAELFSWQLIRFDLLLVFLLILIPSFAYFFIKTQFQKLETSGFKLYRKKEAELAQLRSQVNPHFLFNTLNTLYAFALKEGSEKTAESIAKLANLMRFMLDDMEKESILLEREISYIQDYIKLQSIRSAVEHDIEIKIDTADGKGYSIAPMLMIPFVENAFKHGMNPNKKSHLKIDIIAKENKIQFVIENNIDDDFKTYYKEKGFGIGIENVKSRLLHIYPGRHTISIAKTNDKFIVILSIDQL